MHLKLKFLPIFFCRLLCCPTERRTLAMSILLTIDGHQYDVCDFVNQHPGEGHNGIYLEDFENQNVSEEFEYYHADKLTRAREWLDKAKEHGEYNGIKYIGEAS